MKSTNKNLLDNRSVILTQMKTRERIIGEDMEKNNIKNNTKH